MRRCIPKPSSEFRTLYTSEVVDTVMKHGIEVTHDYATKEGAIPLPVTLTLLVRQAYRRPWLWSADSSL